MTNREFYTAIANGNLTDEVKAHANDEITKLDARNAKRSSAPSKTAVANEPIKTQILGLFTSSTTELTSSEVGTAISITTNKAASLLRQLAVDGKLNVKDVRIKGRAVKCYSIK